MSDGYGDVQCANAYRFIFIAALERCDTENYTVEEIDEFLAKFIAEDDRGLRYFTQNCWENVEEYVKELLEEHLNITNQFFIETYMRGFYNDHAYDTWKGSRCAYYQFIYMMQTLWDNHDCYKKEQAEQKKEEE